jgi:competence protein ComEA
VLVAAVAVVLFLHSRSGAAVAPATVSKPHATASSASAGRRVTVDVAGKVHDPGLVRLPPGSRVADALQAAGGAISPKDVGRLNLARKVTDGEQILVGITPAAGAGPSGGAGARVSLNQATASQLEELPDVGPVLAQRIVDYRTEHGSFTSVDQLRQVSGIGEKTYADLKDKVRL